MSMRIAVIPGDGIGPEVVAQALKVLEAATQAQGLSLALTQLPYGGEHYLKTGQVITDGQVQDLRAFDAIFLGAVGHPKVPPGVLEQGLLLRLRFELDLYINWRPVKLLEGVTSPLAGKGPSDINFDVVRENTEDLYTGAGGVVRRSTPQEVATQEMLATRFGAERCLRWAFEFCRAKKASGSGRGQLTLVHKTNVLRYAGDLWMRAFEQIGQEEYPDIQRVYHHVDACAMYLVLRPEIYDTIVTSNMFGDILTDLGAAISGGMGVAASANLNGQGKGPGLFEPIHGSAPDIAGQGKANPLAAIASAAMLLRQTASGPDIPKAAAAADRIEKSVRALCKSLAGRPMDRLGMATAEVGRRVLEAL